MSAVIFDIIIIIGTFDIIHLHCHHHHIESRLGLGIALGAIEWSICLCRR